MIQKILLLALLAGPLSATAQRPAITLKIPAAAGGQIGLIRPQHGEYFNGHFREYTLDSTGTLVLPNNEKVPGFYYISYRGVGKLFVEPGKSYTVTAGGNTGQLSFSGPDADAQRVLNEATAEFYQNVGLAWEKEDSVFDRNKQRAIARRDSVQQVLLRLHEAGKMNKAFFAAAQKLNNAYHAAVLGATLIMPTLKASAALRTAARQGAGIDGLEAQWQQLPGICDVHDRSQAISMEFNDYVNNLYCRMYLKGLVAMRDGTYDTTNTREAQVKQERALVVRYFREPMREYLQACWLGEMMAAAKYYDFIPAEYAAFKKSYPNSGFNPPLAAGSRGVEEYIKKVKAGLGKEHRMVEHQEKLKSFSELAAAFRGKTVYVDIWATWCGPCKAAFAHNQPLKQLLKKKGVEALYLSIDRAPDALQWKEMIVYYDLAGYHARASDAMSKDLHRQFGNQRGFSIPRYIILKDGQVAVPAASGPGDLKTLEQQLDGVL